MEIPLNILHNYIGFPVLVGLGFDSLRRYKRSRNTTTLQFAWASLLAGIACFFFGIPALFTDRTSILSLGTLLGDIALGTALMFLWTICIRAFFGKRPALVSLGVVLAVILFIAVLSEAFYRFVTMPDNTKLIADGGRVALVYMDTVAFKVLNGLNSVSLLLTGSFFWAQGKSAPDIGQAIRIRSVAVGFLFSAAAFIVTPTFPVDQQIRTTAILLTTGLSIIGLANLVGPIISRRQKALRSTINQDQPPAAS